MKLSDIAGGGLFRLVSRVRGTVSSGVTGNILTLTAPDNQVARLKLLVCSSTTQQAGISVIRDGNNVLSGTLAPNTGSPAGAGYFFVAEVWVAANISGPASNGQDGCLREIVGKTIVINKDAGNTTQSIEYAVEYGVMQ